MTQGRLQQVLATFRQRLLAREAKAEVALRHAHAQVLQAIQPYLDKLYRDMQTKLADDENIPLNWLYEANRLKSIQAMINNQMSHYAALTQLTVGQLQHDGVQFGTQAAQAQMQATVPAGVRWSFGVPSPHAIAALVGATQKGSPLADLFAGFGEEAAAKVAGVLTRGVTLGQNPRTIARDVQDALNVSRNRALVLARNELNRAYRGSQLANYRANSDTVSQYRWTCDKSARTCLACLAMDGSLHDLDEEMAAHVACRCVPVPVTKSWSDILGPLGIDTSTIEETSIDIQSGSDWLDEQPRETQKEVLGNKYDGWVSGAFSLREIAGMNHDPDWGSSVYEKSLAQLTKGGKP